MERNVLAPKAEIKNLFEIQFKKLIETYDIDCEIQKLHKSIGLTPITKGS